MTSTSRILVRTAAAALVLALAGLAAGCAGSTSAVTSPTPSPSPTLSAAHIKISPSNGQREAKPGKGLVVTVKDGTLLYVEATTGGDPVGGKLDATGTTWRSRWALNTGAGYRVKAAAVDADGRTVLKSARFRTLTPDTTFSCQIFQGYLQTYGVGMPIMLQFSRQVDDKRAVERALSITSSKRVVGAWSWDGDQSLSFRPRNYWPAHAKVRFVGHLDGVQISPGVYGTHTLRQTFLIGRSLIVVGNSDTHRVLVYKDRHLLGSWAASMGRPGKETPNGTYLTIEKANPQRMVGEGYDIQVPYSVRFTWSGSFLHAASWSVGSQGYANVSHGCVNLSPAHAQVYYGMSIPGDPVTITGSPRAGKWDDGWTQWFVSWKKWWRGSALRKAVRVGPDGSTWVRPSVLKPSTAKAPLSRPKPDNAAPS